MSPPSNEELSFAAPDTRTEISESRRSPDSSHAALTQKSNLPVFMTSPPIEKEHPREETSEPASLEGKPKVPEQEKTSNATPAAFASSFTFSNVASPPRMLSTSYTPGQNLFGTEQLVNKEEEISAAAPLLTSSSLPAFSFSSVDSTPAPLPKFSFGASSTPTKVENFHVFCN